MQRQEALVWLPFKLPRLTVPNLRNRGHHEKSDRLKSPRRDECLRLSFTSCLPRRSALESAAVDRCRSQLADGGHAGGITPAGRSWRPFCGARQTRDLIRRSLTRFGLATAPSTSRGSPTTIMLDDPEAYGRLLADVIARTTAGEFDLSPSTKFSAFEPGPRSTA